MDIRCPVCTEPWEIDTLHAEVEKRFPNKPWYVETKPEPSKEPDTITPWCAVIIGTWEHGTPKSCSERKDHAVHSTGHEFVPQIRTHYKTWNYTSYQDNDGLWYDELIYDQHYQPIRKEFQRTGCATFGAPHGDMVGNRDVVSAVYDIMGDDLDGAASAFEDAEQLGLL